MKVFQMNDCDWWAGENLDDCLKGMAEEMGTEVEKLSDDGYIDEPFELSEKTLNESTFVDNLEAPIEKQIRRTFKEELNRLVATGAKFPCLFATTEF